MAFAHWVGVAGFEPTASSSRTKRATKLRHTPVHVTFGVPFRGASGAACDVIVAGDHRPARVGTMAASAERAGVDYSECRFNQVSPI